MSINKQDYRNTILWVIIICCAIPPMYFILSYGYNFDYNIDHMNCKQLSDYLNSDPYIDGMRAQLHYDRMKCTEMLH